MEVKVTNPEGSQYFYIDRQKLIDDCNAIACEKVIEMNDKLRQWIFHNADEVCGNRMIDTDYLDAHIQELFYEYGIYKFDAEGGELNESKNY